MSPGLFIKRTKCGIWSKHDILDVSILFIKMFQYYEILSHKAYFSFDALPVITRV